MEPGERPNPFRGLLYSRKFWLAVVGVVQTLALAYLEVPPEVWTSINALLVVVIGSIAYEDGSAARGSDGGVVIESVRTTVSRGDGE